MANSQLTTSKMEEYLPSISGKRKKKLLFELKEKENRKLKRFEK